VCGRYGRRADKQRIAEWKQTHDTNVFDDSYFEPSFNIAPQTFQPVVRLAPETGERELTVMRWGVAGLTSFAFQFFTVMVSESTAFLPVMPSSPANKPR
jgi:putative SOS response-associated peptidase YedK